MTDVSFSADVDDDNYIEYVDENDEATADEYAGGSTPAALSLPDQSPRMEIAQEIATAVTKALNAERDNLESIKRSAVRVTTNLSGEVLFQRFTVPAGQAIQIVREKELRGNITITNFTADTTVYVGLHAGIMVGGSDTAAIVNVAAGPPSSAPAVRTIRTKRALWAIAAAAVNIDVQEEFD